MTVTPLFKCFWYFAAERQAMFYRRLADSTGPWTDDPILQRYRFTNSYRASDRVSQFLIREVQYRPDRSDASAELFFRTMLFKVFNRIETWQKLERQLGPITWRTIDLNQVASVLERLARQGIPVYSSAYIMPPPRLGYCRKYENHLALIAQMMADEIPERVERARSFRTVFEIMRTYPGIGGFLAFQYAIDLNYSAMLSFDEKDFVVAGPGAIDGIAKCFENTNGMKPEDIIMWMTERQDIEFARLGIVFKDLFGRRLQPVDCQNIFCEISKYARVAYPELRGRFGRTRIKQVYQAGPRPLPEPMYPPKWGLALARV
jgi:hypothetical protein